jgi:hypothetical protein
MTYRNEAPYLREWIEFHRLVGVERFFLYDNESTDEHQQVVAPYVSTGLATVESWSGAGLQHEAFTHCFQQHREDARWIAFIDADEFLFSPRSSVAGVLRDLEDYPGVASTWPCSVHLVTPGGPTGS